MSRWISERALRRWVLWVGVREVRLLCASALQRLPGYEVVSAHPINGTSHEAVTTACAAAIRLIRRRAAVSVTLALPQMWTPVLRLTLGEPGMRAMPKAVREAYLQSRLCEVFGGVPGEWRVRLSGLNPNRQALAFAVDEQLARSLGALRAGLTRVRLVPTVTLGARRTLTALQGEGKPVDHRARWARFTGWYVHGEDDRDVALWIDEGRPSQIALLPANSHLGADLSARLTAWQLRLGMGADPTLIVVGTPDARPPIAEGGSCISRGVWRGLYRSHREDCPGSALTGSGR